MRFCVILVFISGNLGSLEVPISVNHWPLGSMAGIVGSRGQNWSHYVGNPAVIRGLLGVRWTSFRDRFKAVFSVAVFDRKGTPKGTTIINLGFCCAVSGRVR